MKYLFVLVVIAAAGCKPKVDCRDYQQSMLFFDSRDTISDTVMRFEVHQKGSNFSNQVDSGQVKIHCQKSLDGKYRIALMSDDLKRIQFNHYDWSYTFYPSGKRIAETEIAFHKRKKRVVGDGYEDAICANDLSYKVNDSLYSVSGMDGPNSMPASIHINY